MWFRSQAGSSVLCRYVELLFGGLRNDFTDEQYLILHGKTDFKSSKGKTVNPVGVVLVGRPGILREKIEQRLTVLLGKPQK